MIEIFTLISQYYVFDFICVSIFSRKWQKISDCECPDLIQNETPVRFLYGKIRNFIPIPDRYAEHDTHKAVSIQIVGTVVCGMVKQF